MVMERALPPLVLAVAGRTRAGKTTLTAKLSAELGWPSASFSNHVKAVAAARALPLERRPLQDLGAELVEAGPREFVSRTLAHTGIAPGDPPFLIEGVRHVRTLDALVALVAPARVALIYLDVSDGERNRRLAAEGISVDEGREWERHSTELEVPTLLEQHADLVLDADRPPDYVANRVLDWISAP